jgi:hypothetical protein
MLVVLIDLTVVLVRADDVKPFRGSRMIREDNISIDLREVGCEDGRWMELAQDCVQWRALVLAVLNLWILLP